MKWTTCLLLFLSFLSHAQSDRQPDAARIKLKLQKLNVLGAVLYVAAHPDDENTQIITQLSNGRLTETAYLSMTRGDGGQNLIGPEIRDELGLIRTQELLAARRIDGGKQFFTRANDFGFSKSATETFELWDKDAILSDVVKVYRQFQPDIIITRFPPDERAGHGHHTASAMLAHEAFDAAAKGDVFPTQLKELKTWQVKRLYTNTGRWWNTTINENTPGIVAINVGGYSPLLGTSYSEIAARSRSQHKSQGYGSSGRRGEQLEFLEYVKGEKAEKDIFEGINTTWSRVNGSAKVQALVDKVTKEFDENNPAASISGLLLLRKEINNLEEGVWKKRKLIEVEQLIQDCLGLYVAVTADRYWAAPGEVIQATMEIVNRSSNMVSLQTITSTGLAFDSTLSFSLKDNISLLLKTKRAVAVTSYSDPYWLKEPHTVGRFTVTDPDLIGKPENDAAISMRFAFLVDGQQLIITSPIIYRWADPVKAELTRPFTVVPPVFVNLNDRVMVFSDEQPHDVRVTVKSSRNGGIEGKLTLKLPVGWRSEPASIPFTLASNDEEEIKKFTVYPAKAEITTTIKAVAEVDGKFYDKSLRVIAYDHIPTQLLLPTAEAKVARVNLKKEGALIGYIKGAGDEVPAALRTMGYEVWEMKNEEVTADNLKRVSAVVAGVRAFNVNDRMLFLTSVLLDYVKQGGTMVVQYNTQEDFGPQKLGPYPMTLSRNRVTEEDSEVRFLKPDHPVLNTPNKITASDFQGWVQERALVLPVTWDPQYETILSMNDKNDKPQDATLLVTRYGEGYYIYTGLSFFRELPEGVSGAYKLFANLVSARAHKKTETTKSKTKAK